MKKQKTNIEHLRDLINGFKVIDSEKGEEALEFLDAIQEEMYKKDKEIEDLEMMEEPNDTEKEPEYDNSDFVGLDTLNWSLDGGNLKIQQQVESFIERLKRENLVVPA
jgi:hypothetical protein